MKLYLIRHSETDFGTNLIHQNSTCRLSSNGKIQAQSTAKRLIRNHFDLVISSPYTRARQTAKIIKKVLKKPLRYSKQVSEIKKPKEVEGKGIYDEEVLRIIKLTQENYHNPKWKYSDEETFFEAKLRAKKLLAHLLELNKDNILIVTHADFMRLLVGLILMGDKLGSVEFLAMQTSLEINNAGITVCEYRNNRWRLVAWNEHSHLNIGGL